MSIVSDSISLDNVKILFLDRNCSLIEDTDMESQDKSWVRIYDAIYLEYKICKFIMLLKRLNLIKALDGVFSLLSVQMLRCSLYSYQVHSS